MTYTGPIVDAHHHVWRRDDLEWLSGAPVPRIFGPYEPIRRDYLIDEYVADATGAGITESVYVQTNWPLPRVLDEVRWLADVHAASGWPTAVIGAANLFEPAARILRAQASLSPLLRGTRHQLHWHERPEFRFAARPDALLDPVLARNLAVVEELGWLFELQVFPAQMADAATLVAAFPGLTFVLVHAGMLIPGEDEAWRAGMSRLAEQPNVVVKLTGQGTFVHRVDPGLLRLVTDTVLELFGPERAMFGTNFPIEKLWTTMPTLVDAWRAALAGLPAEQQRWIFAENARRVYRLTD
ncbi:amidohydrolase family protein [Cryptosporangium japonicum]|uniref:Amidohydrolase family protein n=1 Tax=Cryptosporangium japonicum TaxID=80872 RepID=A0ABN0TZX4_9ACTN